MTTPDSNKKILPKEALSSLKEILIKDIGAQAVQNLSDREISQLGYLFLTIASIQCNIRLRAQ